MNKFYTLKEASELIGKSSETIRRWAMNDAIGYKHAKQGVHGFLVSKADIDDIMSQKPDEALYITTDIAADMLKCHPNVITKFALREQLPAVKWCRNWYILKSAVMEKANAGYDVDEAKREASRRNAAKLNAKRREEAQAKQPKPVSAHTAAVIEKKREELADSMKLVNRLRKKQGMKAATL